MTLARFPVAVILQRIPLASRWASERWEPVAIELAASDAVTVEPIPAAEGAEHDRWRFGGHVVELHRSEAEGYYLNVTAPAPKAFVLWRTNEAGGEPPVAPVLVTVSYNEAARMLDGGEQVDAVPLPPELRPTLEAFVAAHYRPEPKKKIRRNDPFADGAFRRGRDRLP
jgi:hypothetical protein